jgi:hypothetical protein
LDRRNCGGGRSGDGWFILDDLPGHDAALEVYEERFEVILPGRESEDQLRIG